MQDDRKMQTTWLTASSFIYLTHFTFSASCEIGVESWVGVFPTCHTWQKQGSMFPLCLGLLSTGMVSWWDGSSTPGDAPLKKVWWEIQSHTFRMLQTWVSEVKSGRSVGYIAVWGNPGEPGYDAKVIFGLDVGPEHNLATTRGCVSFHESSSGSIIVQIMDNRWSCKSVSPTFNGCKSRQNF